MLFYPWRNELVDILNRGICKRETTLIEANRKRYDQFEKSELESVLQRIEEEQKN